MRVTRIHSFFVTTLLLVASCAYIIPPEQNAPRNNEVRGDIRRPQLNTMVPQGAVGHEDAIVASNLPAPTAGASAVAERRVPVENQPFMVSAMGYAPIDNVPPRPTTTGPTSVTERMQTTQSTLEHDRAAADTAKEKLAHDTAVEPSMLSDLPKTNGVAPAPEPVHVAPNKPLAPTSLAPLPIGTIPVVSARPEAAPAVRVASVSSVVPKPQPVSSMATLPASPTFAPPLPIRPLPPVVGTSAPPMATAAVVSAPPVTLPTPSSVTAYPQTRVQGPSLGGVVVRRGDFDPLSVEEPGLRPIMLRPVTRTDAAVEDHASDRPRFANNEQVIPERYYTHRR